MKQEDWDCAQDGHIPASAGAENFGLARGTAEVTWCLICGQRGRPRCPG